MTPLSEYFDYRQDANGQTYIAAKIRGIALLRLPATNKGTAFTIEERIELGVDGLLPPRVTDLNRQLDRLYANYLKQPSDLAKYQFLRATQERSEVLFYALLERHLEEMVPIVYTPTIGQAVQQFSSMYTTARGLTFSVENIDRAGTILDNYPWHDIRMMVVTDSSAILGIGDQGMGGLAISIGKLALYTAGGGLCPFQTLPVNLDVGTNRDDLLADPFYLGVPQKRLTGPAYFEIVDKFVAAVQAKWPKAIIQWEDFAKNVAFDVLERYRDRIPCFNDDIQGTGAVALAGLLSACRLKGEALTDQTVVVAGAGAGGIGVAAAIKSGMIRAGLTPDAAQARIFVIDAHGLVVKGRTSDAYKSPLAQDPDIYRDWGVAAGQVPSLQEVIAHAKPSVLLGLSGVAGLFSREIVTDLAGFHAQPIIFPLSNPTDNCEANPQDLLNWSEGRAIVATGSPFPDASYGGRQYPVGQGNNAFIFPGLGLAATLAECSRISDEMVQEAAYALADYTAEHWLDAGLIYPPVADLKKVCQSVAKRVLAQALRDGSASRTDLNDTDLAAYIESASWRAEQLPFKYEPA
ncbi:NAD-dependent malic enzyme [Methylomonas sp. MED-D]|uniref:NAD-dependent malic enzyme n=1 Tax=Methylomonas koyamae TaxID=702114 RepID=A0A177NQK4_9GAMM|nr:MULTISPECIES: NAD-dependent malic enzyme [Methylomonas]MDT4331376.1 NAD-dependent malic enzyme [Methylomonas sp. MV1]OAI20132.1 NAD-dependent malic enzyme [Methylomonas koyamae]WGS84489.1 NAD-dependent malic enzyme [Methylomonas sp. UP202]